MISRVVVVALVVALFTGLLMSGSVLARSSPALLPAPTDLRQDAAQAQREGKPVVILFSLPGCAFCHVVRQNYLAPLLRNTPARDRPIIREVEITGTRVFAGFQGEPVTHEGLAKHLHIRFAPTVVFLDSSGRHATEPIVGGDTAGWYGAYLDKAFAEAARKLSVRDAPEYRQ